MKNKATHTRAFTLIELLMVIAIIGILAGILIPTVGAVRKQAKIASSKAQLSNYVTAIQMYKGEYGYFPFLDNNQDVEVRLESESLDFIKTLSARDPSSNNNKVTFGGNRRQIGFHSFGDSEFWLDEDNEDQLDPSQIADNFNNVKIFIKIDGDGKGQLTVPSTDGNGTKTITNNVTAWTEDWVDSNGRELGPAYYLYN